MQRRFIAIESNSGFVWGEATADTALDAARIIDTDARGYSASGYESLGHDPRDTSGYFILHDATGSAVVVGDGQDSDLIAAVSALPIVGYVRAVE